MAKVTVSEIDKKVALVEQQLLDHVKSCEKISEDTLARVKRLEYFIIATLFSVVAGIILGFLRIPII